MDKTFEFTWQYDHYEVRTTRGWNGKPYIELVKWCESSNGRRWCYTLAYWHMDDEGPELHFVGDRPLRDIAKEDLTPIWTQLCLAQQMLQDWYDKEGDK